MAIADINGSVDVYTGGITTSTAIQGKDASQMGMDDFFNLLVAQMSNQDMMNPQSNTEFIAQMAQFSSLQGMKTVQEYQLSSYAVSYVGKNVTIANINEVTGNIDRIQGVVESISFYDGRPKVIVGGKAYDLHTVMEVTASGGTQTTDPNEASDGEMTYAQALAKYKDKLVTLLAKNSDGMEVEVKGIVETVRNEDGKFYAVIDGKGYLVNSGTVKSVENPPAKGSGDDTGDTVNDVEGPSGADDGDVLDTDDDTFNDDAYLPDEPTDDVP